MLFRCHPCRDGDAKKAINFHICQIIPIFAVLREIGDKEVPYLFFRIIQMEKTNILQTIAPTLEEIGCFLVEIDITRDNDITIAIEKETGDIDLEDCIKVNDVVVNAFDRDVEDYSLTVTSAGLDQPFKVLRQYLKAVGTSVDVRLKGGKKLTGTLVSADETGIALGYSQKEAVEGKKKKVLVEHEDRFTFEEINSVIPHIEFSK